MSTPVKKLYTGILISAGLPLSGCSRTFFSAAISLTISSMSSWSSSSLASSLPVSLATLAPPPSKGSMQTVSVPLISQRQYGHVWPADFC